MATENKDLFAFTDMTTDASALINTTATLDSVVDYSDLRNVFYDILFYSLALIIPIGICANILSLVVFIHSSLRKTSTGHYLISLAFADLTLLIGEFIQWLHSYKEESLYFGISLIDRSAVMCKLVYVVRYFGRTWSSWLIVIITIERFIIVRYPLHASSLTTPRRAKIICVVEIILTFGISLYPLYTVGLSSWDGVIYCLITNYELYNIMSWIVLRGGNLLVAGAIVTLFTTLIIYDLISASRRRERLSRHSKSKEAQMTKALVFVAILFVTLRLPFVISYYLKLYKTDLAADLDPEKALILFAINKIANILAVLNYAINFFLYCLCGTAFRRELVRLFRGCYTCNKRSSLVGSNHNRLRSKPSGPHASSSDYTAVTSLKLQSIGDQ